MYKSTEWKSYYTVKKVGAGYIMLLEEVGGATSRVYTAD